MPPDPLLLNLDHSGRSLQRTVQTVGGKRRHVLLGQLIENVSGQTFEQYVTQNILKRSGIEKSEMGFDINPAAHATCYHKSLSMSNVILRFLIDKRTSMGRREGKMKGHRYVTHAGGGGGYHVELRLYPALRECSVIMYNRSGLRDERMLSKVDASLWEVKRAMTDLNWRSGNLNRSVDSVNRRRMN